MATKHIRIHGKVQGVWYRGWTVETATNLGLTGWVRNRSDGTVEALIHGPAEKVEELIKSCHNGPPHAQVTKMDIEDSENEGMTTFEQKPTL
ncbi:MAG: acylphosphatase [Micavibrio sp.]|nr:MAG: acylphosphatase [Micavibrio sp.]